MQQTRVEAVKGYYARFMQALPTVDALAACEEERLLKLWEGLGYYSRARNLQKAAKMLVSRYGGAFPDDYDALRLLPGVGDYTAGAIASIAFGKPIPAVDGNVVRVASRLERYEGVTTDGKYKKELAERLAAVYPEEGEACGAFTQSLFELGALLCKPRDPDCKACPLQTICRACIGGVQTAYPVLAPKKEKRAEQVYVFLIETPNGFCIRRRETGVLRGMNEFPSAVYTEGETAANILNEWGMSAFTEISRKRFRHVFTHIRWEITCVHVRTESAPFDTYGLDEIAESISLPTAFRQCLRLLQEEKNSGESL